MLFAKRSDMYKVAILTLLLAFSVRVNAQDQSPSKTETEDQSIAEAVRPTTVRSQDPEQMFSVGINYLSDNYTEPGLMKYSGTYWGPTVSISHRFKDSTYFLKVKAEYETGGLRYDGGISSSDGSYAAISDVPGRDSIINSQLLFGKYSGKNVGGGVEEISRLSNYFYGGLGYRTLSNRIEGKGSYDREVDYIYVPVGMTLKWGIMDNWTGGLNVETALLLSGTVNSKLSQASPNLPDVTNHQDSGFAFRVALESVNFFGSKAVKVSPYLEFWDINDSDVVMNPVGRGGFIEPANTTLQYGANVSFLF